MKAKYIITDMAAMEAAARKFVEERKYQIDQDPYSQFSHSMRATEDILKDFDKTPYRKEYIGEIVGTFFNGKEAEFVLAMPDGTFTTHNVSECMAVDNTENENIYSYGKETSTGTEAAAEGRSIPKK